MAALGSFVGSADPIALDDGSAPARERSPAAFPEYDRYAARTPRFIPGIY
jgi:hypothetical protein